MSVPPTHAGGVVVKRTDDGVRYLLVSSKRSPREWVLPKGHIEPGESPEDAARREVMEEGGVDASIRSLLAYLDFSEQIRVAFYLMDLIHEGDPLEDRRRSWMRLEEALRAIPFKDTQEMIKRAATELSESA